MLAQKSPSSRLVTVVVSSAVPILTVAVAPAFFQKTAASMADVLQPKVDALWVLHRLLAGGRFEFHNLPPGQYEATAALISVDGQRRRSHTRTSTSSNWDCRTDRMAS
jgi:hypothetical protein